MSKEPSIYDLVDGARRLGYMWFYFEGERYVLLGPRRSREYEQAIGAVRRDADTHGLIATAPEMFELLLDIVADYHAGDMDVQSVAHEAKRLIAKVRGEVTP